MQLTQNDVSTILRTVPFFKCYNSQAITQHFKTIAIPKGCLLVMQGNKLGDDILLLLQGSFAILYNKNTQQFQTNFIHQYNNGHVQMSESFDYNRIYNEFGNIVQVQRTSENDAPKYIVAEQYLISTKVSPLTYITNQDSIFLLINYTHIEHYFNPDFRLEQEKRELIDKIFPIISETAQYSQKMKDKIYSRFHLMKSLWNNTIQQQADNMYIVMNGEYSVNYYDYTKRTYKPLCVLEKYGIFGEEQALEKQYFYKIICQSSTGLLVYFSCKELLNLFSLKQLPAILTQYNFKKELYEKNQEIIKKSTFKLKLKLLDHIAQKQKIYNKKLKKVDQESQTAILGENWFSTETCPKNYILKNHDKHPLLLKRHNRILYARQMHIKKDVLGKIESSVLTLPDNSHQFSNRLSQLSLEIRQTDSFSNDRISNSRSNKIGKTTNIKNQKWKFDFCNE